MENCISLDLIIQILCRLPVQSLLRFECVSKQWGLVIKDKTFIKLHLQHSKKTSSLVSIHCWDTKILSMDLNSMVTRGAIPPTGDCRLRLIGSFNGLTCLSSWNSQDHYWEEDVILWNMSTREHLILPKLPIDLTDDDDEYYLYKLMGFGYDSTNDDYKLIKIFETSKSCNATIYSLRSKSWGKMNRCTYWYCIGLNKLGAYARGAFHWFAWDDEFTFIIAFNCNTEEEQILQLPFREGLGSYGAKMEVLGEDLCLLDGRHMDEFVDVWVMKEYGVKESWTKLFTIRNNGELGLNFDYYNYPSCFKNGDEEVLVVAEQKLVYYNLRNKSFRRVPNTPEFDVVLRYDQSMVRFNKVLMYHQSLVRISE